MPTIPVSPYHHIELAEPLWQMLESPPERDYVVRQLSEKSVNGQPLIQGELVISGKRTRESFPLATDYPVHFRKTYYPICFHQDPAKEYENHLVASQIIQSVPPPIGSTRTTFRSCFFPGLAYDRLSPFGAEPEESNLQIGENLDTAAAIGLWKVLCDVYDQLLKLHHHGFAHGDLFLHNVIVSTAPIGAYLIDFEQAVRRSDDCSVEKWEAIKQADLQEIFKEGIFLQCALGKQTGTLAEAAIDALPVHFKNADRFHRAIALPNLAS